MTTISVRLDDDVKNAFEATCEDIGIPMSVAMNIFAKRMARERRFPFDVSAPSDPFYSESNMRAIDEADKRVKEGHYIVKTIEELEAMENA